MAPRCRGGKTLPGNPGVRGWDPVQGPMCPGRGHTPLEEGPRHPGGTTITTPRHPGIQARPFRGTQASGAGSFQLPFSTTTEGPTHLGVVPNPLAPSSPSHPWDLPLMDPGIRMWGPLPSTYLPVPLGYRHNTVAPTSLPLPHPQGTQSSGVMGARVLSPLRTPLLLPQGQGLTPPGPKFACQNPDSPLRAQTHTPEHRFTPLEPRFTPQGSLYALRAQIYPLRAQIYPLRPLFMPPGTRFTPLESRFTHSTLPLCPQGSNLPLRAQICPLRAPIYYPVRTPFMPSGPRFNPSGYRFTPL